jgi:transposase
MNKGKGREPKLSRKQLREIFKFKKAEKCTDVEAAAHFGVSVNTVYNTRNRYKKGGPK